MGMLVLVLWVGVLVGFVLGIVWKTVSDHSKAIDLKEQAQILRIESRKKEGGCYGTSR
jgi:uncharacterized membrane protein (DUF106 family)